MENNKFYLVQVEEKNVYFSVSILFSSAAVRFARRWFSDKA
jgi:hypothetical protein